jgi:hypothetical protein
MEIWVFLAWLFSPEPTLWVTGLNLGVGFTMALAPQLRNIRLAHLFFSIAWLWAFLCVTEELAVSKMSSHFALPIVFIAAGAIAVLAVLTYRWVESNHQETKQASAVDAVTPVSTHPQQKPLVDPTAAAPTPPKKQAVPKKSVVPNTPLPTLPSQPPPIDLLNMSEARASYIGDALKKKPAVVGTVKIVSIGAARQDLADQLGAQFGGAGWTVEHLNMGTASMAGFTPREPLYVLSPHIDGELVKLVLSALGAASITAPTHPELPTIGPASLGIPDVTIVLQP